MRFAIRDERPGDAAAIGALTTAAFAGARHASGTESEIVAELRSAGALALSLLAERDGIIVGHAAFSQVAIDGAAGEWFGLGPVSVAPDEQRLGIGGALIEAGLARLRDGGAAGCVVLGDPGYYARFGFAHDPALTYPAGPPEAFRRILFTGEAPRGMVRYQPAFG